MKMSISSGYSLSSNYDLLIADEIHLRFIVLHFKMLTRGETERKKKFLFSDPNELHYRPQSRRDPPAGNCRIAVSLNINNGR